MMGFGRRRRAVQPRIFGLLASVFLFGAAPAVAQPVIDIVRLLDVATIGDWVVGCDNRGACTMVGHADMADPNHIVANSTRSLAIRIVVGAPDRPGTSVSFVPDRQLTEEEAETFHWGASFRIAGADHGREMRVPFGRRELADWEKDIVLRRLQSGTALTGVDTDSGAERLRFSWVGFGEAWAEVARRQREIAAWRRQERPADGEVTLVRAVPAMVSGVPGVTAAQMDWCPAGVDARNLSLYDLGGRRHLWAHACPSEERNPRSRWFMSDGQGDGARLIRLPRDFGSTTADTQWALPNARFEFDFGVLRSARLETPAGDCGRTMLWGWTGTEFVLVERRIMPVCQGLDPEQWIVTYKREARVGWEDGQ